MSAGWWPALRIARRTVRRNIGRSLLVAVLVGLPVAGATYADIMLRTFDSPQRQAQMQLGSADAMMLVTNHTRLRHFRISPWGGEFRRAGHQRDASAVDVSTLLPPGSTAAAAVRVSVHALWLERADGSPVRTSLMSADLGSPLTRHQARLVDGSAPSADEVAVTQPLAQRLGLLDGSGHLRPDAAITVRDGATEPVSGLVRSPYCLDCERVVAQPGADILHGVRMGTMWSGDRRWKAYLVTLPDGTDAEALAARLAADGVALTPRNAVVHPEEYQPPGGGGVSLDSMRAAALAALIIGLGLLEVILLAGTAFAVGARRQVRSLGLVAATGGSTRQVRRIVLTQGLVLGLLGAGLGIAFGTAVALLGKSLWEGLANGIIPSWHFGPWEIAVAALVGCVSGLLAAVIPAVGAARMAPVDALAGRFRISRARAHRTPVIGAALVAGGVVAGMVGDQMLSGGFSAYVEALARVQQSGGYPQPPSSTGPVALVLLGAVLAVAGMVVLAPSLLGWLSRIGRVLPLSGRLAVRDAARHRHRTGPATSAIAVAVAGSVVLAFIAAGNARADELRHVPSFPDHTLQTYSFAMPTARENADVAQQGARAVARALPGSTAIPDREIFAAHKGRNGPNKMPLFIQAKFRSGDEATAAVAMREGGVAVADPPLIRLSLGRALTGAEQRKLESGAVLVTSSVQLDARGRVHLAVERRNGPPEQVVLPGVLAQRPIAYTSLPSAFVPASVVDDQGWRVSTTSWLVTYPADTTADELDAAIAAGQRTGASTYLDTVGGDDDIVLLLAALAAAFVTLVGVAISVALSAAEGRADLATLAAVGAPPRRRRSLAAAQALMVGGLGCLLGLALGTFVAYTLRATIGAPGFVVPWQNLVAVGVVVPLLAVLVAAVCTPSRLPMVRRLD